MDIKVNLKSINLALIVLFLSTISTLAQPTIVKAEYFINEDPGFGLGIPITIPAGQTSIDLSFTANTDTLSSGYHFIYARTQDALGVWSYLEGRSFYVTEPTSITPIVTPKIVALEYFINEDPGQGLATLIDVMPDDYTVDITDIAITDTLSAGYHIIGTRAKTEYGNWGWYERRSFYVTTTGSIVVPPVQKITDIEYYFDHDPGQGQATSLGPYSPNLTFDLNELIPTSLSSGYHTFNVRSRDENGNWGFVEQRPVYVITAGSTTSITDINKVEYFFDGNDPGIGQATNMPISPGQTIDLNTIDIPTPPTLIDGEHTITFRARNGNGWGLAEIDTFDVLDDCTQPTAAFDTELACAGSAVVFNNTTLDLQGDATYRWYLDGDAIIDETTQNASFTYPFPGTYIVALAIRQGTICLDSIATTIEIQPQPVAVFSTSGGVLNQPTSFVASASNLPAGASWEWDFDGDFTVDDNTAGNTSFIYSSEGTFNPSLTITDGLGCFVTISNPVTVSSSGGGSSPPFVDFLANNNCVGNSISFIDISQNLPSGSTYSWDFDGDGTEDSSNSGTTSFTYTSAGSFDATLTIDLGGPTISATNTMEIVDIPFADFSADDVCEGAEMSFTDLSTSGTGDNVYMWDFNNDGVVDSNASTDVKYTYPAAGMHIASLKISNGNGCVDEIVKQVNVLAKPTPNFDWNIVCTGEEVLFNNLSTNVIAGATYSWDLDGDGIEDSNSSGNVNFVFPAKGIYSASLTINNLSGCATTLTKDIEIFDRPAVALQINAQCYGQESQMIDLSQNVSGSANYRWDFQSDGIDDDFTVGNTSFTYPSYNSYIVKLTIDNGGNCVASTEQLVEFADAATPDFKTNKLCEGEEVVFTNLSTDVNPAAIYSWDFDGDGNEDSAFPGSTAHTFSDANIYNATLTIDNGGNCLAYKTIPLEITPPPVVDLGMDEILCEAGTVTFDAGSGYISYLWPDGSTQQTYTVDQIGEYTVKVQDAKLCYNTDTIAVRLVGPPIPKFQYSFSASDDGLLVSFENLSTNYDSSVWRYDGEILSFEETASLLITDWSLFGVSVYEICLTTYNQCDDLATTYCENVYVSPTDLFEQSTTAISAYPSPTRDVLYLDLSPEYNFDKLLIIGASGETVWYSDSNLKRHEIDVTHLGRGIYYVIGQVSGKLVYQKITKL